MLSSMNVGGVEKSFLSLLSSIPKDKYTVTLLLLEKKGGFLNLVPDWVKVEEVTWYQELKPVIMQPPQKTVIDFLKSGRFIKALLFVCTYFISKKLNDRYIYYRPLFKEIPEYPRSFDIAIAYQGPTEVIDYYVANKVKAYNKSTWIHFDVEKHVINKKLYTKLHQQFDSVHAVSEEAKQRLLKVLPYYKDKPKVFPNIIQNKVIHEMSMEHVNFDKNYKGIKIVTVGRLSKEKGQDMAIQVLSKLKQDGYKVRWYCIGEGRARSDYEKLINEYQLEESFMLLGSKMNPYPYVKNADIYVQPSRHEGFCLTLAEAKCLYKPIVTTDFTGAKEQITDGFNGLIVKGNFNELYESIKYLIDTPEVREKLSNNLIDNMMDTTQQAADYFNNLSEVK
nr:glycosyltransferase [Virgibacillus litoralis]